MKWILVPVDRRDRLAERSPYAVVIDARRHDEDQHFILADRPGWHDLDLHGAVGRAVPVLADPDFRELRQQVEAAWPRILPRFDGELGALVTRSREDWNGLDKVVADLVAAKAGGNNAALLEAQGRFDSLQAAAHDKLEALSLLVEQDIRQDYEHAAIGLERAEWMAGIATALSLLLMAGGITLFYRTILNSIDRLIEGAERFSEGDRDHRIEVQIPKELHLVAEELNKMIGTIRESEDRLIELAQRDRLTGLLNRASWEDVVGEALQRMHRTQESFALVAADIDHFKQVNDTHGHDAGDDVLRRVALAMTDSVRIIDKVFRLGGEEFCIIMPATDAAGARVTAERIRQAVAGTEMRAGDQGFHVTISLGIAVAGPAADAKMLSKQADIALYKAKVSGRNAVVLYEEEV